MLNLCVKTAITFIFKYQSYVRPIQTFIHTDRRGFYNTFGDPWKEGASVEWEYLAISIQRSWVPSEPSVPIVKFSNALLCCKINSPSDAMIDNARREGFSTDFKYSYVNF